MKEKEHTAQIYSQLLIRGHHNAMDSLLLPTVQCEPWGSGFYFFGFESSYGNLWNKTEAMWKYAYTRIT